MNNAYIFFGKSGSGKGTQAQLLIKRLEDQNNKVLYIETGAHLREFSQGPSYIAGLVKQTMVTGDLLPEFVAENTWANFLINNYTGSEILVLDGVARRLNEAEVLENALMYIGIKNIYVIFIKTSDEWSTDRLLGRGRFDDDTNEIKKRLDWFNVNTLPSIEYFKQSQNNKFIEINGEQVIENVHNDIVNALEGNLN